MCLKYGNRKGGSGVVSFVVRYCGKIEEKKFRIEVRFRWGKFLNVKLEY